MEKAKVRGIWNFSIVGAVILNIIITVILRSYFGEELNNWVLLGIIILVSCSIPIAVARYLKSAYTKCWAPFTEYFGKSVKELQTMYVQSVKASGTTDYENHYNLDNPDMLSSERTFPISVKDAMLIVATAPNRVSWGAYLTLYFSFEDSSEIDDFILSLMKWKATISPKHTDVFPCIDDLNECIRAFNKIEFVCKDINQWDMWRRFAYIHDYMMTQSDNDQESFNKDTFGELGMRSIIFILRKEVKHLEKYDVADRARIDRELDNRYYGYRIEDLIQYREG